MACCQARGLDRLVSTPDRCYTQFAVAQPSPSSKLRRPDWLVRFGRRLMLARGRAGLTQLTLAAPDLSKSFISLLESARTYPSVESVLSLARRVNSSVGSLLMDPPELRLETALNLLHLAAQMDLATRGTEAVQLTATAEALLPDMPVDLRVRAALLRARAAIARNRLEDATRSADEAMAMARRYRLASRLGMALALKGEVEVRRRTYTAALPLLEEATSTMQRMKAARTEENVRALISLGTARIQLEQITSAQRAYRRALQLATRLRLHALRGKALTGLALVESTRRHLDAAVAFLTEAHEAFSQVEDLAEVSRVLNNLGQIRREQGRLDDALAALEQALRVQERLREPRDRSAMLDEMGQVLLALGRHVDAARAARRAIKEAQAGKDRMREAAAQVTLGRVLRAQGRRREAITLLRGAVATFKRLGLESRAATASHELARMLADAGAKGEAPRHLKQASSTRTPPQRPSPESVMERLPG